MQKGIIAMRVQPVALVFALLVAVPGHVVAEELPCAVVDSSGADRPSIQRSPSKKRFVGERFARTELFFGLAKSDGEVTEAEFKQFLDRCVTPRFPRGLTLVRALGLFRGSDGAPIEERSMLLILLYPKDMRRESSARIEEIREAYKRIFHQESVLRSDRCCEEVGF